MKNLIKVILSISLLIFVSGCQENLNTAKKPKIDTTLEVVDYKSIKTISDMKAIAFEWQKVDDPRVKGYNLYRATDAQENRKLKRIKYIDNRYTTHYLDKNLEPNTKYYYSFSSVSKYDDFESKATKTTQAATRPAPEQIALVKAVSNLPRQIKIIWRPHNNTQISYYKIFKSKPSDKDWDELAVVKGRLQAEYIDKDLKDNVLYQYKVLAYTFDDIKSFSSPIVKAQTKKLPMGPKNIISTNNEPRKITLTWMASPSDDIIKFKLYKSSTKNGSFNFVRAINKNIFTYIDKVANDGEFVFYKVRAVDEDGLESSKHINATQGRSLDKPKKPIVLLAQIQGTRAVLNWKASDDRADTYTVYKTIKKGYFSSETIKFNNIKNLRFEDKDIRRGVQYKYSLSSVDEFGIISEKTDETLLILSKTVQ